MKYNLRTLMLTAAVFTSIAFSACKMRCVKGSGVSASEGRKVEAFNKLKISGAYKVILKQDSSFSVRITGDDNLLSYIRTNVSSEQLSISSKKNLCSKNQITVVIGIKQLERLSGSGAIEYSSESKLNLGDLEIHLAGATKTNLDMNVANLTTESAGSSDIKLTGQASTHTIKVAGNADLEALDFVVGKYEINASGAFDAKINVLEELNAKTTGAADIKYRGAPKNVNTSKTGASTVKKID